MTPGALDINPCKYPPPRDDNPATKPTTDGTPLLIAVGAEGARQIITPDLLARGYTLGVDAWFVA